MNGTQKQSQSQSQGAKTQAPVPQPKPSNPGDDPGTLSDEDYLEAGGPDPHPDSPPGSRRDRVEDPERSGGAEDRSNSM